MSEAVFTEEQQKEVDRIVKEAVSEALDEAMRKQAKLASKAAAEAMLEELTKNRKERYDKRLRNTKLLLKNYRTLKQHIAAAVYDNSKERETPQSDVYELMNAYGSEHQYIESIQRSVSRTRLIMKHVDTMLRVYQIYCEQSGKPEFCRNYRVIFGLYVSDQPKQAQDIADDEHIDKRTVYKDVDAAVEILTPLFFGVDGIKTEF